MIEVYSPTFPLSKPLPYQPNDPEVSALVQQAIKTYPAEEARIRRGAEIVEKDGVRAQDNGVYLVGIHRYYVVNGHCECPDATVGHAPEGKCKHRYAKTFYRKLHAAPVSTVRTKQFIACLDDTVGIATLSDDGRATFAPYDAALAPRALSNHEIVYTLVLGNELSA